VKHEIFENIITKDDVGLAINKMINEGKLYQEEGEILHQQIKEAFKNSVISSWFDPGWEVKTENSVLLPGGSEYRPDRVLIKNSQAVVIDYKFTVKQSVSHKSQVREYMKLLTEMGYEGVKGFLWYVEQRKVEEINI